MLPGTVQQARIACYTLDAADTICLLLLAATGAEHYGVRGMLPCLFTGKPLPAQPPAPETLGVDKSKTPRWEVVVHVHSISLIMEKLPPVGYKSLGAGPDLGTVSSFNQQCSAKEKERTALHCPVVKAADVDAELTSSGIRLSCMHTIGSYGLLFCRSRCGTCWSMWEGTHVAH